MAVVTDTLKNQVIADLLADFNDSANNYYIAIGRSEDWNDSDVAPSALRTLNEERKFRNAVQSVKKVIDATFVVPRYNWSSGAIYSAYNDQQIGYPTQSYYVMNDNNQVYICIQQSQNTSGVAQVSTVQPSGNTSGTPFETADGYIWKFLYSISALDANKYISANFLPVKLQGATDSDSQASDIEQAAVQSAAIDGQIVGYILDSGGAGYTAGTAPTLTVVGDGTGALAIATVPAGATSVAKVEVQDSAGSPAFGSGYKNAKVTVSGGGSPTKPAKVTPIFAPTGGLGADPRNDLRSTGILFNVKPEGIEGGDFIIGNDFRQVGLFKNIKDSSGDSDFTASTGIALKKLVFSSVSTSFTADNTILGGTSGVKALIDKVDSSNIWYHQNDTTGYGNFDSGEAITEVGAAGAGTLDATYAPYVTPEVLVNTGDVLYIDNRSSVTRSADQTEDIKIVIQI